MDTAPEYIVEYAENAPGVLPMLLRLIPTGGMELVDFFAAHAMSGLLASGQTEDLAAKAYAIAERMFEERDRCR